MLFTKKTLLLLFTSLLIAFNILSSTYSMSVLKFKIKPQDKFCLHEFFSDQTLVTIMIISEKAESLNVIIRDSNNNKLIEKKSVHMFKDSFTTFGGGHYEVCMLNLMKESTVVEFELKHGIEAKDYSQIPKLKDLKPVEQSLQKLEDFTKELYHLIMYADSHEKTYGTLQEGIIIGISWVSIIIIVIMLLVGGIEAFVGRKIVMNRKLK